MLREHVLTQVIGKYAPIMQGRYFGGWSVYSANGHYNDGWHQGHMLFKQVEGKQVFDYQAAEKMGKKSERSFRVPTEICFGYMAVVMSQIEDLGFEPRRARVSIITKQGSTSWHRDAEDKNYAVRLHIPIITNENCFFENRREKYSMPADGSAYLVRVNCEHRAYNLGPEHRYHLIMQVWDHKGLSKFNAFDAGTTPLVDSRHV
jgi:hypothetical protein